MRKMTVILESPEAIAEVGELMDRFGLTAKEVVERIIVDAGMWMPMETLGYPRPSTSKRQLP